MKFYKENHINPAASCLPLLAQFPVFIALYLTLKHCTKHITGSWLHVVPNISDKHATSHWSGYLLLAIYAGSQVASTYFMGATMDKTQRNIMMFLPLIFITVVAQLPDRPRHLLDDDEPLDGRAGPVTRRLVPKPNPPPYAAALDRPEALLAGRRAKVEDAAAARGDAEAAGRAAAAAPRQEEEGRRAAVSDGVSARSRRRARPSARRSGKRCATSSGGAGHRQGKRAVPGRLGGRARPARRRLHAGPRDRDRRRAPSIAAPPSTARDDESELETRMRELVETRRRRDGHRRARRRARDRGRSPRDVHRRRPRTADRQARPDDRRVAVRRERGIVRARARASR